MILCKSNKAFIGPHNIDILSILYGTLLGNSFIEKRYDNVRFSFQQENRNVEYYYGYGKDYRKQNIVVR